MTSIQPTPDQQQLIDLREYVTELRTKKGTIVDALDEPPLHHPACDDVDGRFQWFQMSEQDGTVLGYFYTPKGVQL